MINSNQAYKIVTSHIPNFGEESVQIDESLGKVLAEDILADRHFPPFNRVMMDGIAISFANFESGAVQFDILSTQFAGEAPSDEDHSHGCIEIMTGAMLPECFDTIIKYEDIEILHGVARILQTDVKAGQHVHRKGTDRKSGDILMNKNIKIGAAEISILSTVGKDRVRVRKMPSVAIVSTGDELVEIGELPLPHQIRTSNSYALSAALQSLGVNSVRIHINDEPELLKARLKEVFKSNEVVILSGGVSRGKKDYVPAVLEELGVVMQFHKVAQRPGKPFWFGYNSTTTVFALPGNPVSTFMCYHKYVVPWVQLSLGIMPTKKYARLTQDFEFLPDLTYFLQVTVQSDQNTGELHATPVPGHGSGDLANLIEAKAFLELPQGKAIYSKGEVFELIEYH